MTKTLHTPGPWTICYDENGKIETNGYEEYTSVFSESEFGSIAEVLFKKTNILGDSKRLQDETFEANARLIAAAPELLEALQNCLHILLAADMKTSETETPYKKAKEAIDKATGKTVKL